MAVYEQVKLLYDQELYSNVISLASMLLSASENNPELLAPSAKYQTFVFYANSLYHLKEYKRAEVYYKKALQFKKSLSKAKGKTQPVFSVDTTSEVEVKYKAHQCLVNLKQYTQAITILESIPARQRNPAVNMALAKLHHQNGTERVAVTSYKEVLKECPFAIDAAQGLLTLGVKLAEVVAFMQTSTVNVNNVDWLLQSMKAKYLMHSKELPQAIAIYKQLDKATLLRDNVDTLVALGEMYYYNGEYQNATASLERAYSLDPLLVKGMDSYAALLARDKRIKELERLTAHLVSVNEFTAEPWVTMGYFCFCMEKLNKALNFAQKACIINPRNVEALLLKGSVLQEMKKPPDAITHYSEAYKIAPYRFEVHKGLVDCYIDMRRMRDALGMASSACKQLGHTARALTLYASVMAKDSESVEKAKTLLERALKQDPTYLKAVYLLAGIYEQESMYEKGIELLKRHMEQQTSCKLHQMMGDFLRRTNEHDKALHHFTIALNMDPSNTKARDGTDRIEQNIDSTESFDVDEIHNVPDSDSEVVELEESEVEGGVWSDVELI